MKSTVKYEFHHFGIPFNDESIDGMYSEHSGMYTIDNPGKFKVQWHRFTKDSSLHKLIQTVPHVAFKVDNFEEAIRGEVIILGPYEPIDGYVVAMIDDAGVPIEIIKTSLSDEELWKRAREKKGLIYRSVEKNHKEV